MYSSTYVVLILPYTYVSTCKSLQHYPFIHLEYSCYLYYILLDTVQCQIEMSVCMLSGMQ